MYTFMEKLEAEVRNKVLKSLKEQNPGSYGYPRKMIDEIVEEKLSNLAEKLVNIFYEEN